MAVRPLRLGFVGYGAGGRFFHTPFIEAADGIELAGVVTRSPQRRAEVAEDWQWCARFGYQVIERRGTGGGAFRLMYSRFLEEARRPEAPLAAEAAARWTDLAGAFHAASERDDPDPALWSEIDAAARRVAEAEERLWTALA